MARAAETMGQANWGDGMIPVGCSSRLLSGGVAAGIGPLGLNPAEIYGQPTTNSQNNQ